MPTPGRSKESTHTSAYAHTTFYGRTEPRSSRGRSPEPSHTTRAATGLGGDSDPDYSHRPSRPYSYKPAEAERFTTLRPNPPIHEERKSDGSRYTRYSEPPGTYYATPGRERYSGRHSGYTESSRKSRTSEEFEKPHGPPPSPPPEKEKDRTKYKYTFRDKHETSDEDPGPRPRRRSSATPNPTRGGSSRTWGPPYVESEDDSDDGAKADDEKAADERSFEERMAGMNFGQTKDEKVKASSGGGGLKEPTSHASMAPETPRRTPSPCVKSPAKSAQSPLSEKKKASTRSASPSQPHAPPPPPLTTPGPGVFA